jgi:hypothetical protein
MAIKALQALDALTSIGPIVEKYQKILGTKGRKPIIEIKDNVGSAWLAQCAFDPRKETDTTIIRVQKVAMEHPQTLERVVAHEMVHHDQYMTMAPELVDHDEEFEKRAAKINAIMGPNFVTKESDKEFVYGRTSKPFYVLIIKNKDGQYGFLWSPKLTTAARVQIADTHQRFGARLFVSSDAILPSKCKARIGSKSICSPPELQATLGALYETGKNLLKA